MELITLPAIGDILGTLLDWINPMMQLLWKPAMYILGIWMAFGILNWIIETIEDKAFTKNEFKYETDMGDWFQERHGKKQGFKLWKVWQTERHRPQQRDYFGDLD